MKSHGIKALTTAALALLASHSPALTLNELTKLFSLPTPDKTLAWQGPRKNGEWSFRQPNAYFGATRSKNGQVQTMHIDKSWLKKAEVAHKGPTKLRNDDDVKKAVAPLLDRVRRKNEEWALDRLVWNADNTQTIDIAYQIRKLNGIPVIKDLLYVRAILLPKSGYPSFIGIADYTITPGKAKITKAQALRAAEQVQFPTSRFRKDPKRGGIIRSELTYAGDQRKSKTDSLFFVTLTPCWTFSCKENGAVIYIDARDGKLIGKDEYK